MVRTGSIIRYSVTPSSPANAPRGSCQSRFLFTPWPSPPLLVRTAAHHHHALTCSVGWVLFMMFCGVGFVSLPLGCFQTFAARPKATITRSEYITRAKDLAMQAKAIKVGDDTRKLVCCTPNTNNSQKRPT